MNRLGIVLAAVILAALVAFAWLHQRTMQQGLPPRTVCPTQVDALAQAGSFAKAHGGAVVPVLGTGSMAPYIPAAPAGEDPRKFIAAYVVMLPGGYGDVKPGALCIYRAPWAAGLSVIHQAAQKDADGWVMSGLHNTRSEAAWRVTPANFIGIVAKTFVF